LKMVKLPEIRSISCDQLLYEVKGIYVGLVMVEAKCVEADVKQAAALEVEGKHPRLIPTTSLHEYHNFFLASHHPSSSPAFRRLSAKIPHSLEHASSIRLTIFFPSHLSATKSSNFCFSAFSNAQHALYAAPTALALLPISN